MWCTIENLDKVIELTGLLPSQYIAEEIVKDSPIEIYKILKGVYVDKWGKPDKTAIDFTGGTKAMSAITGIHRVIKKFCKTGITC